MRHLDEPFAAFGSVFSVARLRIVFADTSQLLMEQEVIPYRQKFHDYCREACQVIGIDAWGEYDACIAVQYAEEGVFPKVILVNKTTYHEPFEDVSVATP